MTKRKDKIRVHLNMRLTKETLEVLNKIVEMDTQVDSLTGLFTRMAEKKAKANKHIISEYNLTT